jgi:regulatory protein
MTSGQASGSTSVSRGSTAGASPDPWTGDVETGVRAWVGDRSSAPPPDLPPDPAAQGPDADPESVARTILLDQLTGRARTRKELSDKLAAKHVPAEIAGRLLDRFEEVGLVDDGAFARLWVGQRQSAVGGGKGLARRALANELRRKGVDDETAREALDEVDPADEEAAARELVRRKLRSLARFDDQTATRRLVGMLARKGYPSGLAFRVVKDELAVSGRDEPEEPHSV